MSNETGDDRKLNPAYNIPGFQLWRTPTLPELPPPDRPPFVCLKFNAEWLQALLPLADPLRWADYYAVDAPTQDLMAQRGSQMLLMLSLAMNCEETMRFRQNPTSPCQFQASYDEGANWETIFDFSLCPLFEDVPSQADVDVIVNILNEAHIHLGDLGGMYDGTPGSIAPDSVYDASPTDAERDAALCGALYLFVRAAVVALNEIHDQERDEVTGWIKTAAEVIGYVAAAAIAWYSGGAASATIKKFVGGLILSVGVAYLVEEILSMDTDVLQNEAAWLEVSCCLYTNMSGQTITYTRYQNALTPACAWIDPDAATLASYIEPLLNSQDSYLLLLDLYQKSFEVVETGAELPCDCAEWDSTLDFSLDAYGFTVNGDFEGDYVPGIGFVIQGAEASTDGMRIDSAWPSSFDIKAMAARIEIQCGSSSTVDRNQVISLQTNLGTVTDVHNVNCPSGDGTIDLSIIQDLTVSSAYVLTSVGALGSGAECIIQQITISGSGAKPAFLP